jgi:hypothetical protein
MREQFGLVTNIVEAYRNAKESPLLERLSLPKFLQKSPELQLSKNSL